MKMQIAMTTKKEFSVWYILLIKITLYNCKGNIKFDYIICNAKRKRSGNFKSILHWGKELLPTGTNGLRQIFHVAWQNALTTKYRAHSMFNYQAQAVTWLVTTTTTQIMHQALKGLCCLQSYKAVHKLK